MADKMRDAIELDVTVDENIFKNVYTDRIEFFENGDESTRVVWYPGTHKIEFYYSIKLIDSDIAHSLDDAVSQVQEYINDL